MNPLFSIIIPTYRRPVELGECLDSLTRLEYPQDRFETLVVDDGSPIGLEEVIAAFRNRLNLHLVTQANAGPAQARNTGAVRAKGEYLAFTDDDCRPDPRWLEKLEAGFESHPDCLIGGKTSNRLTENPYSTTSQLILDAVYQHYNRNLEQSGFFASNNMAAPAKIFRGIGGFDPNFRTSEDRELCDRWRHSGYRMFYAGEAVVYHAHDLTLTDFCRQHFDYGRGAYRFHRLRALRQSGRFRDEISFHLNYRNWLFSPLSQTSGIWMFKLAILMIIWQIANASGLCWEAAKAMISGTYSTQRHSKGDGV